MERAEVEQVLKAVEARLAGDPAAGLRGSGFWKAVAAAKRDRALVEEFAGRIAAADREAFERWALLTVPFWLGTAAAVIGTLAGLALVWLAYYASDPWNALSLLAAAAVLQLSTHGPAHLAAGRLAGIRFTHWFIGSLKQIQPGVKTDYASYLAATPKGRAWMHASGAVMTKIVPFALIPAGLAAEVPSWAVILLAASGALSIFTDIVWSTRVSDWKKFRREMKIAATAR